MPTVQDGSWESDVTMYRGARSPAEGEQHSPLLAGSQPQLCSPSLAQDPPGSFVRLPSGPDFAVIYAFLGSLFDPVRFAFAQNCAVALSCPGGEVLEVKARGKKRLQATCIA